MALFSSNGQHLSDSLPHPTPSPAFGKRPGVGTQTLVLLNFSAVVAPLIRWRCSNCCTLHKWRSQHYWSPSYSMTSCLLA